MQLSICPWFLFCFRWKFWREKSYLKFSENSERKVRFEPSFFVAENVTLQPSFRFEYDNCVKKSGLDEKLSKTPYKPCNP